jgi:phosphohistidine phosphatase SixA
MKVILVRHAEAEPRGNYPDDGARPLTKNGVKVQKQVAKALARMGTSPDRIVTSPLVRANQTAMITAEAMGYRIVCRRAMPWGTNIPRGGARAAEGLRAGRDRHACRARAGFK